MRKMAGAILLISTSLLCALASTNANYCVENKQCQSNCCYQNSCIVKLNGEQASHCGQENQSNKLMSLIQQVIDEDKSSNNYNYIKTSALQSLIEEQTSSSTSQSDTTTSSTTDSTTEVPPTDVKTNTATDPTTTPTDTAVVTPPTPTPVVTPPTPVVTPPTPVVTPPTPVVTPPTPVVTPPTPVVTPPTPVVTPPTPVVTPPTPVVTPPTPVVTPPTPVVTPPPPVVTPIDPNSYQPTINWFWILVITFICIMIVVGGIMFALREYHRQKIGNDDSQLNLIATQLSGVNEQLISGDHRNSGNLYDDDEQ